MNKSGAIVVIDDDGDDQDLMKEVFKRLRVKNEVVFLSNGEGAIEYLNNPANKPFLVLSDISLPRMDGISLRKKLLEDEDRYGAQVPFIYLTTGTHRKAVLDAYACSIQGFFIKPMQLSDLQNLIKKIIDYWSEAVIP